MFSIAINAKQARDNYEFSISELSKGWISRGKFLVIHDKSEGSLRKLASVLYREFKLESRVYEI